MPNFLREARRCRRRGDYMRAGDLFDLAGETEEALEMYRQAGQDILAARLLERLGNNREAARHYQRAGDFPRAAKMFLAAGDKVEAARMMIGTGDFFQAAGHLERAGLALEAAEQYERANCHERAAMLYVKCGHYLRAARLLDGLHRGELNAEPAADSYDAATLADKRRRFGKMAADLFYKEQHFKEAAQLLLAVKEYFPAGRALEKLGRSLEAIECYVKGGRPEEARRLLNTVDPRRLDAPSLMRFRKVYADVLYGCAEYHAAAPIYVELGEFARAGECFDAVGDLKQAASAWESAGQFARAGDLYARIGATTDAARMMQEAGDLPAAAELYKTAKDFAAAAAMFERSGNPLAAASMWTEMGEDDQAITALQSLEKSDASYVPACLLLGHLFVRKKLPAAAIEKLQAAATVAGDDPTYWLELNYLFGLALEQAKRLRDAAAAFARVLSHDYAYKDASARLAAIRQRLAVLARERSAADGTPPRVTDTDRRLQATESSADSRYEIEQELGSGGQGTVFLVRDNLLDRRLALKLLNDRLMQEPHKVERFIANARNASRLSHRNVVTIFDTGTYRQKKFIAMDYVKGPSLRDLISSGQATPVTTQIEVASQLLTGLGFAHSRGVVHGNLRPENVFIDATGEVKITDFGLTERLSDLVDAPYGARYLAYVSPEQVGGKPISAASDLFSFGVVMYEFLTGKLPFPVDRSAANSAHPAPADIQSIAPDLPIRICKVTMQCLSRNPEDRYESADDAIAALKPSTLEVGAFLGSRYEITGILGQGGMGRVYAAHDRELDEKLAIKVLKPAIAEDGEALTRFKREIKLTRMIQHPNVVQIYDLGEADGIKFITMEIIPGLSLKDLVAKNGRLPLAQGVRWFQQVLEALAAAHKIGIIHRDIKPQNILIDDAENARIVDFGIATVQTLSAITTTGVVIGTPEYMSPEQVEGRPLTGQSDLYSVGITMFETFTGKLPFTAESAMSMALKHLRETPAQPRLLRPDLPIELEQIILRSVAKDPTSRFQSAKHMSEALAGVRAALLNQ